MGLTGDSSIGLTELLVDVLSRNPKGLTVSQIYTYITNNEHFDSSDKSWKGNVRHILSKKRYFYKTDFKEIRKRGKFWIFDRNAYNKVKERQFISRDSTGEEGDPTQNYNYEDVHNFTSDANPTEKCGTDYTNNYFTNPAVTYYINTFDSINASPDSAREMAFMNNCNDSINDTNGNAARQNPIYEHYTNPIFPTSEVSSCFQNINIGNSTMFNFPYYYAVCSESTTEDQFHVPSYENQYNVPMQSSDFDFINYSTKKIPLQLNFESSYPNCNWFHQNGYWNNL